LTVCAGMCLTPPKDTVKQVWPCHLKHVAWFLPPTRRAAASRLSRTNLWVVAHKRWSHTQGAGYEFGACRLILAARNDKIGKSDRRIVCAAGPDGWMICESRLPVAKERKKPAGRMLAVKKLFALALAVALTSIAAARVWVTVYRYDGKTPMAAVDANYPDVYREIMVGTRLTLVISSDAADKWGGELDLSWDDALYGKLSGRGLTPPVPRSPLKISTYKDSCLDAAGTKATVMGREDSYSIGLFFDNDNRPYQPNGGHPAYPGDWFVADYYAEQAGECSVRFYAVGSLGPIVNPYVPQDPGPPTLLQTLSFKHVPSRDFNGDTVVNFKDFARFAVCWRSASDPNTGAGAAFDLSTDSRIDSSDLASFTEYWLERTDCNEPPANSDAIAKP
jgi:hypothetical protein